MIKRILMAGAAMAITAGAAHAQTETTLWHAMGGALGEAVNAIATDFNAAQDRCALAPIYKGTYEETMTAGIAAFRAGEQPHIIQIFDAGAATIINAKGATYPVSDLMPEHGVAFDGADYISGVRNFYADQDGDMIGMPFNSSTPILYYNVAALEAAGVEPPKTWEEFEAVAPKLKEAGFVPLAQSHLPWIFSENFHSRHNIPLSDADNGFEGMPTRINYNNEDLKFHFSKLKEWKDEGLFGFYGTAWGDNESAFANGEAAMWLGSSGSFGGLKDTAGFEFSTTYLPYWEQVTAEPTNTFIGGAALFAFNGHEDAEYACVASFFEHLTQPETQVFWHKETGYVPITLPPMSWPRTRGITRKNRRPRPASCSSTWTAATGPRAIAWVSMSRSARS